MDRDSVDRVISIILRKYGRSFSHELSIPIEDNTAPALFQLLTAAVLVSRARLDCGLRAARLVFDEGWSSPETLAQSTWEERTAVLSQAGYTHHDTVARVLGDAGDLLLDWYEGDVHQLRQEARYDPIQERILLKKITGVGDSAADFFFREVQIIWDEIYPFADRLVSESAALAGLPTDPATLAFFTNREGFVRLAAGLVRMKAKDAFDDVRKEVVVSSS
ncbi:MAG TPA: hypothetical protein PLG17_02865 [Thermodesulfobacteriota bacterium]|nr:hypothetical protein [Deltaproteobacteria bacterium]HQO77435.1 hypothetical protein [Thermodesulfobacteriota bacterium]